MVTTSGDFQIAFRFYVQCSKHKHSIYAKRGRDEFGDFISVEPCPTCLSEQFDAGRIEGLKHGKREVITNGNQVYQRKQPHSGG